MSEVENGSTGLKMVFLSLCANIEQKVSVFGRVGAWNWSLPGGVGAVGMGDLAERLDRKKRMLP